jgi:Repeat of unknown function (DUF5650)
MRFNFKTTVLFFGFLSLCFIGNTYGQTTYTVTELNVVIATFQTNCGETFKAICHNDKKKPPPIGTIYTLNGGLLETSNPDYQPFESYVFPVPNCNCTNPTPSVNNISICSGSSATLTVTSCSGSVSWNDGTSGATRTVYPTFTTNYTATCSVGTCSGTATGTVTVTSKPTPSVNSPTICSGSGATLSVSNCGGSVTWNDGTSGATHTVYPTFTTNYTATCSVGTCSGTATGTVTVTSKPTPSVNSPTICSGSGATLSVSNCGGSVTWNDGTSGASRTVYPTFTTNYTATCSVGTCSGTATGTVTVTSKPTPSVSSPTICSGSGATLSVSNCGGSVTWNDGTSGATRTVYPTFTTNYTATCSVGTCSGTATGTVTVTSKPTPSVNSPTICSGSGATLSVSNCGGSVTWNDGTTGLSKTVSPTTTTTYTATCKVGTCSGTATSTVTVSSSLAPSVNSPTICSGSSATLTVTNCSGSVTWNDGTTGLSKVVSPTTTTTYTATCTVGTCSGTATSTVTVSSLPIISITTSPCAADGLTYSVNFTTNAVSVQADKGMLSGNTVTGIPSGQIVTLTATSAQGCETIVTTSQSCTPHCIKPDAGLDIAICLPKTSVDLLDAPTGYMWVVANSNPVIVTITPQNGEVTGMNITGNYQFILQKIGDATCSDIVQVVVRNAADPIVLCNDASTSYTIVAPSMLTNVIWYNRAGTQVGTGSTLVVKSTTLGLEDGSEAYYYKGVSGNATTICDEELCCPISFLTKFCCPTRNCVDITTQKN